MYPLNIITNTFFAAGLINPEFNFLFLVATVSLLDIIATLLLLSARTPTLTKPVALYYVSFILFSLISSLANSSSSELDGFDNYLRLTYYFMVAIALANREDPIKNFLQIALIAAAINLTFSWFFWLQSPRYLGDYPMLHIVHQDAPLTLNRNYNSFFLALGINVCCIYLTTFRAEKIKINAVKLLLFSLIISTALSFSKGGWLAAAIPLLIFTPMRYIIIVAFLSFALINLGKLNEISSLFLGRIEESGFTNDQRVTFINDALNIIDQNILFGVGTGMYREASQRLGFSITTDPHNTFLWLWAELGIFFVMVYIIFVVTGFVAIRRYFNSNKIGLSIAGQYFVFSVTSGLPFSMKFYWLIMILAITVKLCSSHNALREKKNNK